MRHVRMRVLGLVAVAVAAVAATTAGSAWALPEWGRCRVSPAHEGRYTDANCTIKAKKVGEKFTGEFEWEKATAFTSQKESRSVKAGGLFEKNPLTLNAVVVKCEPADEKLAKCRAGETEERTPLTVQCEGVFLASGEFSLTSAKEIVSFHTEFYGCHDAAGAACANESLKFEKAEALIITEALKGTVGYIKKAAPKEVGIDWKPESGKVVASFTCGENMRVIVGGATEAEGPVYPPKGGGAGVIASVTPVNEMVGLVTQVLTANAESTENVPSSFEGKPLQALEDWSYNPNGALGNGTRWGAASETLVQPLSLCGSCDNGEGRTELKA